MGPLFWIILCIFGALLAALIVYGILCLIEPHRHELTHITLSCGRMTKGDKFLLSNGKEVFRALPAPVKGDPGHDLRIFFFSDLHIETCFISSGKILRHIEEEHERSPLDAVIFGGDIITWPKYKDKGFSYLKEISDLCRKLSIPFLAVTGNHDIELDDKETEERCGFELIEGRYKILKNPSGREFAIAGVNDSGREDREWYEMPECPADLPLIFLAHDPDSILHTGIRLPDIMLSGHTHGGQLKLPFGIRISPRHKNELPSAGILAGTFIYENTLFFISRGLGCGYLPIRFGSVPEVSVIEIRIPSDSGN